MIFELILNEFGRDSVGCLNGVGMMFEWFLYNVGMMFEWMLNSVGRGFE